MVDRPVALVAADVRANLDDLAAQPNPDAAARTVSSQVRATTFPHRCPRPHRSVPRTPMQVRVVVAVGLFEREGLLDLRHRAAQEPEPCRSMRPASEA